MRRLPLAALLLLPAAVHAQSAGTEAETAAVRVALEHYLQGHATGDGAHMRLAFADSANLYFVRDGAVGIRTSRAYADGFSGRPAADEAQRRRRIEFIDVSGTAAVAKIVLEYPGVTFTDYMSLLKVGDEWRIIAKTFHADRR